jgi:hypothetical protein
MNRRKRPKWYSVEYTDGARAELVGAPLYAFLPELKNEF